MLAWEPPGRLVLAWNILNADAEPTEVEMRFVPEGDGTRVELEHRGWERLAEGGAEKRANYDTGWDFVLGEYVVRARASSRRARNQRSRSSHGTAAFAGDVDGRTKSAVSPRRRSCSAVLRPLPEDALVRGLPDEAR